MSGECYNPNCTEPADWSGDGVHEAYCSWDCAVEAREGQA